MIDTSSPGDTLEQAVDKLNLHFNALFTESVFPEYGTFGTLIVPNVLGPIMTVPTGKYRRILFLGTDAVQIGGILIYRSLYGVPYTFRPGQTVNLGQFAPTPHFLLVYFEYTRFNFELVYKDSLVTGENVIYTADRPCLFVKDDPFRNFGLDSFLPNSFGGVTFWKKSPAKQNTERWQYLKPGDVIGADSTSNRNIMFSARVYDAPA